MTGARQEKTIEDFKKYFLSESLQDLVNEHTIPYSFIKLKEREIDIICHRYQLEGKEFMTLQELADKFGRSRERIRGIEAKAGKKICFFFEQYRRKKFYESNPR